jgi:hypothetical protein
MFQKIHEKLFHVHVTNGIFNGRVYVQSPYMKIIVGRVQRRVDMNRQRVAQEPQVVLGINLFKNKNL